MALLSGCSDEDNLPDVSQETDQWHTCDLTLNVSRSVFTDELQSRAESQWVDGNTIYLTFSNGQLITYGYATYSSGSWLLSYNGKLAEGNSTMCTAVYFDEIESEGGTVISLSPHSAIYEDNNCSYNYQNGKLSIGANLKPKTGRIRFAGSNGENITIFGISHYSSFDYSSGKFNITYNAVTTTVSSNYTPYIYGEFTDPNAPRLNLITETSAYTRFPSNSMYRQGESGYMTIPTESSLGLWTNSAIFKVNNVEFTMIPVSYTNGNFLLAETETTEELYDAIMGGNSTSQLPKCNSYFTDFLTQIKSLTGLNFRCPNYNEWQYAFIGGAKTQGYIYSGSDILSNVGWYKENSNGALHPVKELLPNELGFYDMSGNVSELVSGASYPSYGGTYVDRADNCEKDQGTYNTSNMGLRLAL
ncbi:MAG: formylglycine-generating enzyme family protein [Duncaniella sp.]|nr:formylglycine-generating enzyme family protein [Duncaniella sp.]